MTDAERETLSAALQAAEKVIATMPLILSVAERIRHALAAGDSTSPAKMVPLKVAAHIAGISYEAALKRAQRGRWSAFKDSNGNWLVFRASLRSRDQSTLNGH